MKAEDIYIRVATPNDAAEILKIYTPYVEKTAISFEYEVPTIAEFRNRIKTTLINYPYIIAVEDNRNTNSSQIAGYAYTGAFSSRMAYQHSVATTIYVSEDRKGLGIGRKLYTALEGISRAQNIINMNAGIGYPCDDKPDAHLNKNSPQFHEHMGYSPVGEFHKCGYKFGQWYSVLWMEKMLANHGDNPRPFIPFPELDAHVLNGVGIRYIHCNVPQWAAKLKNSTDNINNTHAATPTKTDEMQPFLDNLDRLHTTEQGAVRVAKNLALTPETVVTWCKEKAVSPEATITKEGKNWYVRVSGAVITINARSHTIITAHKMK